MELGAQGDIGSWGGPVGDTFRTGGEAGSLGGLWEGCSPGSPPIAHIFMLQWGGPPKLVT